eukprot:XP_016884993.1 interleukin-9 receptor isoform X12 [Homo sapiens]
MPQTCDGTGQMHLGSNCCKNGQTLLQRTCHGVSCCGWWFQAARSILGKGPSAQSLAGWTLESEALRRDMGTWLLACICICTCVCLGVSVTGEGQGPRSRTFTCLTNNILRIDCHWSAPELGQGSSPWLLFTSNQAPGGTHKCILRGSECTVVLPPEAVLVPSDNFTITFHHCMSGREQVSLVDPEYLPRRHVKLDPPSDLQSNISSGHCILTWSISPALEPMTTLLSYELAFKKQEEAWEGEENLLPERALSSDVLPAPLQCTQWELPAFCTHHVPHLLLLRRCLSCGHGEGSVVCVLPLGLSLPLGSCSAWSPGLPGSHDGTTAEEWALHFPPFHPCWAPTAQAPTPHFGQRTRGSEGPSLGSGPS